MFNSIEEMLGTDDWMEPIDYSKHDEIIVKRIKESQQYLLNALK